VPEQPGDGRERLDGSALISCTGEVVIEVDDLSALAEWCRRLTVTALANAPTTGNGFPEELLVGEVRPCAAQGEQLYEEHRVEQGFGPLPSHGNRL
jgi:hypothetical protein